MYSRSLVRSILPVLGLLLAFAPLGYAAAPPNRIQSIGAENNGSPLPYSVSPRVKKATDLGIEPGSRVLDTLMLRFSRTPAQQAALDQLLIDQQNPSSPRYHQWLTPEQFGAQFGLSSDDLAKVSNWLTTQGFTVTGVARSSTFITFRGTVAQAQRAFHTSIHSLNLNGEQRFANTTDIALPPSIAGVVSAVSGLDNFRLKTQAKVHTASPNVLNPQYTSSVSQQHFIAPGDFNTIYNVTPLLTNSIDGSGYSIAIMGQVDLSTADVSAFRKASGLTDYCFVTPTSNPCSGSTLPIFATKVYGTDPGAATSSTSTPSTGDLAEAQLDVEWAGAVAPKANIIFVNSKNVLYTSMLNAIDDKLAPIISISYGLCEPATTISDLDSFNQYFQQANAEGITIVGPSGDSGATECDYNTTTATQGFAVGFPASSPFVTSMGGTMFNEGAATGATEYWNGSDSTGANSGSATKYIPETVWNESGSNGLGAGGGGSSAFFSKPYWQVTPGVTNDYARDVPDVSLNSASGHDGYLFCVQGSCTNGYRNSSGNLSVVGGTSVAAPAFAGILALIEQKNQLSGIGNANPVLYALGSTPSFNDVFHDIDDGNNSSPCEIGTPDCPNGGSIGYSAVSGYDKATGWGSIDASNLATKWMAAVPVVGASPVGWHISATSLTTTSSICGLSGTSLPLTATVTNDSGTSGAAPTGTVQFLVDNVAVGQPVALAGGSANYSLDTSSLSSGGHTVSVVYSGDSTYAGSRGSLLVPSVGLTPIDVISATSPDFSITPCSTTSSTKSGTTAPGITLTFAPVNGFTGAISLSVSSNQAVTASYAFSPASTPADTITLNSNSPTSVTFTLSAFQSSAKSATSLLKMASNHSAPKTPWYIAGSGATLACMFLLVLPRRRRWGALFAVILSVGIIGGSTGCGGSGGSTSSSTSGGSTTTPVITPAAAGKYSIDITAVAAGSSGNLVHHVTVLFTVQ